MRGIVREVIGFPNLFVANLNSHPREKIYAWRITYAWVIFRTVFCDTYSITLKCSFSILLKKKETNSVCLVF